MYKYVGLHVDRFMHLHPVTCSMCVCVFSFPTVSGAQEP